MPFDLAFCVVPNGFSIMNEDGCWWCGHRDGWVHPSSSHWDLTPGCWNVVFDTLGEAVRFAKKEGLL
jgi:hypothetical protein